MDWYDYGARHYDAALGRWHVVDPMAESYYDLSLYVYCGSSPVNYIDPFGMDYWSTNDPNEIARLMDAINSFPSANGNLFETIDFSSWNHSTDGEFSSNLTFNDETNMFYSSYGTFENGVLTSVGVSFPALRNDGREALIEGGKSKWYRKASGKLDNIYPEYNLIRFVQGLYVNPFPFTERSESVLSGFKAHSKGKNWQKHSAPRSGGDPENGRYGQSKNKQKGSKNKKYIVPTNPNKRLK